MANKAWFKWNSKKQPTGKPPFLLLRLPRRAPPRLLVSGFIFSSLYHGIIACFIGICVHATSVILVYAMYLW